ncbi:MAG: hypothetical protein HC921_03490 [Synechococcaceae cyanobacterium SM2_3_1]|nr:hypothetical protein [Synechococcaceae cyanobacterium SM2_3_1]
MESITDTALELRVGDSVVTLPVIGPTQATCTCPATSVCRHILSTCLWLRTQISQQQTPPEANAPSTSLSSHEQLVAVSMEHLIRWAGKPKVNQALKLLTQSGTYQISGEDPVLIQFSEVNIDCRLFAATGLEGMICSCKSRGVCAHRVAAVLAYQQHQGLLPPWENQEQKLLQFSQEAPRSREQVIRSTQSIMAEMISVGVMHLTAAMHHRLLTLAVSALGVDLPRLSQLLRSLAEEVVQILNRDARADSSRLLRSLSYTYALCQALLQDPYRIDLIGQHRSHYQEIATLDLVGMGAYHWSTRSGYKGLTVLFWDPASQRWCTWSDVRPTFQDPRFDPVRRFVQPGPWEGVSSPAELSQHQVKLLGARRNRQGRLSSSSKTRALLSGPTGIEHLQMGSRCFADWQQLRTYILDSSPLGLQEEDPLGSLVVIRPQTWGTAEFDTVDQVLLWSLEDLQGEILLLQVPYRREDQERIHYLEHLDPEQVAVWGIVGQVFLRGGQLQCYPLSLLSSDPTRPSAVINLSFPVAPPSTTKQESDPTSPPSETGDFSSPTPPRTSTLDQHLDLLLDALLRLAEHGCHGGGLRWREDLSALIPIFEQIGVTVLAESLQHLLKHESQLATRVLPTLYVTLLTKEALTLAGQTSPDAGHQTDLGTDQN